MRRRRNRGRAQVGALAELLLLDETNPRSLAFQLEHIRTDLQKLLSSPGMVGTAGRKESEAIPACRSQGGQCGCAHNPSLN